MRIKGRMFISFIIWCDDVLLKGTTVVKCRVEENNYEHAMDETMPSYAMPNKLANA